MPETNGKTYSVIEVAFGIEIINNITKQSIKISLDHKINMITCLWSFDYIFRKRLRNSQVHKIDVKLFFFWSNMQNYKRNVDVCPRKLSLSFRIGRLNRVKLREIVFLQWMRQWVRHNMAMMMIQSIDVCAEVIFVNFVNENIWIFIGCSKHHN